MKVVIIVQARMSSRRVPGKVLKPIAGRPMLQWVMECMAASKEADGLLLATSDDPSDDAVEAYAKENDWPCFRGPLDDVAGRYLLAAEHVQADGIVRISGDSPILPYALIDRAIAMFREGNCDLVTNVKIRSYPKGASVEVFTPDILRKMIANLDSAEDREHVTPWLYRQEDVRIRDFVHDPIIGTERLMVDTPEDFEVINRVLESLERPHTEYDLDEIVAIRRRVAKVMEVSRG